ncbi:hypothetical protein [Amylibacter sp. IMCC11727]|uniref:hypothetical protein n=1 Tax=Amylibacter sp. IMCC11727 TaxID=3039851 RepID=UPI00244E49C4|nr:hypothetical protein [Amylibacter sp. IMCC11727]WGI20251.1 hypothetical protein QBD29_08945 [Amylibacter sp. IMCC11727]
MSTKTAIIAVYIAFLAVFLLVVLFATFLDIIGICTYDDGIMQTCQIGAIDVSALYNSNPIISIFANTSLFFFWILLGGCTLYVRDWMKKRDASK